MVLVKHTSEVGLPADETSAVTSSSRQVMTYPRDAKGFRTHLVWRLPPDEVVQRVFQSFRVSFHTMLSPIDAEEDIIGHACTHDHLPFACIV